jgi:hypothetical protein
VNGQELYKVCPECAGEYRLDIERCADCGAVLVFPGEAGAEAEEETAEEAEEWPEADPDADLDLPFDGPRHELPPSDDLVCVSCHTIRALQALSQALDEAGFSHRLDPAPYGKPGVGCLYVLPRDGDAAAVIDAGMNGSPLAADELPDDDDLPGLRCGALPQRRRLPRLRSRFSSPVMGPTCAVCGAVVWVPTASCPNCAAVLPGS